MAREYPRFLLSKSTTTKSTGYFLIHLLEPRVVTKVELINDYYWQIIPIKNEPLTEDLHLAMKQWLASQIALKLFPF